KLLYIMTLDLYERGVLEGGVAGTLMTNLGLELALRERDIPFVRAKVGDRYVMAELYQRGWYLGGESSGHLVRLKHTTTGDGIIAALQVLRALRMSGKRSEEHTSELQSRENLVCRLLLEKKKKITSMILTIS